MDISSFLNSVNSNITTATAPKSISGSTVGNAFSQLATLTKSAVEGLAITAGGSSFSGLTGSPTDNGLLNAALASKLGSGSVDSSALVKPELGIIINDNFDRTSIGGNWTSFGTGATFSIVSNKLQLSSTRSTYSPLADYLKYNAYGKCNLESFTITMNVVPGAITSTSFGIGLILKGGGLYSDTSSITLRLDSGNLGKIQIDGLNGDAFLSRTGLGISAGDNLILTIKFIKNKYVITLSNTTTGRSNVTEYDISTAYSSTPIITLPTAYEFGLTSVGGTHTIDNFLVNCNDVKNVSYLIVGDSISKGLFTDNIFNRWGELINSVSNTITQTLAGSGSGIVDTNVNSILSLTPQNIIVLLGINDIGTGAYTDSQVQANFSTFISSLTSGGYFLGVNLFLGLLIPNNNGLQDRAVIFNNWLLSNYSASAIIDFHTPLLNSAGTGMDTSLTYDGIHPNNQGHLLMCDTVINRLNLQSKPKKIGNYFPVMYNSTGKVTLGSQTLKTIHPKNQLEILDESGASQLHIHNNGNKEGLYLGDNNGYGHILSGGYVDTSGNTISVGSAGNGILLQGGVFQFVSWAGATPGSPITPSTTLYNAGKKFIFGQPPGVPTATCGIPTDEGVPHMRLYPKSMYGLPSNDGELYYDGYNLMMVQGSWLKSLSNGIFSQSSVVTLNSPTSATTTIGTGVGTVAIPGYFTVPGKKQVVKQCGYITTPASSGGSLTFGFYFENNLVCSATATALPSNAVSLPYELEVTLISTNASHFLTYGKLMYSLGDNVAPVYVAMNNGVTSTTIAGSQLIDLKASFSTATSGQIINVVETTFTAAN